MRTFSRSDWDAAQDAWCDFSPEWREVRHQAAMRGMLYPPSGTKWDSWDDDEPSQRAILIRAIRETPELLSRCIDRSRSWHDVVQKLIAERDGVRRNVDDAERLLHFDKPTDRQAVTALKSILQRIWNS